LPAEGAIRFLRSNFCANPKLVPIRKFKEIKELRGGILLYAAQAIPPIDAEIAEKGHLWTETSSF
jgi:hypothetical protein